MRGDDGFWAIFSAVACLFFGIFLGTLIRYAGEVKDKHDTPFGHCGAQTGMLIMHGTAPQIRLPEQCIDELVVCAHREGGK